MQCRNSPILYSILHLYAICCCEKSQNLLQKWEKMEYIWFAKCWAAYQANTWPNGQPKLPAFFSYTTASLSFQQEIVCLSYSLSVFHFCIVTALLKITRTLMIYRTTLCNEFELWWSADSESSIFVAIFSQLSIELVTASLGFNQYASISFSWID